MEILNQSSQSGGVESFTNPSSIAVQPLTFEEQVEIHEAEVRAAHAGHNHLSRRQASFVLWVTIAALVLSQVLITRFKKSYPRMYQAVSLAGLWFIPFAFAIGGRWYPFLVCWSLFTSVAAYFLVHARATPIAKNTPRRVYNWLDFTYRGCLATASSCWAAFLVTLFFPGLGFLIPTFILDMIIYGIVFSVYFGVLTRDVGGLAAETMTASLGHRRREEEDDGNNRAAITRRMRERFLCALCGDELRIVGEGSVVEAGGEDGAYGESDPLVNISEPIIMRARDGSLVIVHPGTPVAQQLEAAARARRAAAAATSGGGQSDQQKVLQFKVARGDGGNLYQLQCMHIFHESCIKGWCVVGKKDSCPSCSERVDIKALLKTSPLWGPPSRMWGQLLDVVRYIVVWNPMVFLVLRVIFYELGIGQQNNNDNNKSSTGDLMLSSNVNNASNLMMNSSSGTS